MTKGELVNMLVEQAKEYRKDSKKSLKRNIHMNKLTPEDGLSQKVIDAVIVDLVNHFARFQGIDLALYTKDLK